MCPAEIHRTPIKLLWSRQELQEENFYYNSALLGLASQGGISGSIGEAALGLLSMIGCGR